MMRHINNFVIALSALLIVGLTSTSCKKFLDAKVDSKTDTPRSITDLEGMLNYYLIMNSRSPTYGEFSSDNVYITDATWNSAIDLQRALYCWQKFDGTNGEYTLPYQPIFYCNVILETIDKIDLANVSSTRIAQLRGAALFLRAFHYFGLAQIFIKPYSSSTAESDLGLQLKLNSDYNQIAGRSNIAETYAQIIKDYKESIRLLPDIPATRNLPSKPAAYAGLSRVYMSMNDYANAHKYADSCLQFFNTLLDYNSLDVTAAIPFPIFNSEVIYDSRTNTNNLLGPTKGRIDSLLYRSYSANDLRKSIFFKSNGDGSYAFKGNYTGTNAINLFCGFATDEIYLNLAECLAREGDKESAVRCLDTLLIKRWKSGSYTTASPATADEALSRILEERRKELVYRGLRWVDLRRLNFDTRFAKILKRVVNGNEYRLDPNGLRYVLLIPDRVVKERGIEQNP